MSSFDLSEILAQKDIEIIKLLSINEKLTKRHDLDMAEIINLRMKIEKLEKWLNEANERLNEIDI